MLLNLFAQTHTGVIRKAAGYCYVNFPCSQITIIRSLTVLVCFSHHLWRLSRSNWFQSCPGQPKPPVHCAMSAHIVLSGTLEPCTTVLPIDCASFQNVKTSKHFFLHMLRNFLKQCSPILAYLFQELLRHIEILPLHFFLKKPCKFVYILGYKFSFLSVVKSSIQYSCLKASFCSHFVCLCVCVQRKVRNI